MSPSAADETEAKTMSPEEQEELEFEKAAAAAEAQRGPSRPVLGRGRSAPVASLRSADNNSTRARSPPRARSPVRTESSSAELESMAANLRSMRGRGPARPGLTRGGSMRGGLTRGGSVRGGLTRGGSVRGGLGRGGSCRNLCGNLQDEASLQDVASEIVQARHSTGGRSRSPKRGPRRIKSGGDLHEPAHRSLSPNRSCLSSLSSAKSKSPKKSMRRQVSFGSKCYEEIPKTLEEEKNDIWYDKSELKDLRKKVKKLAKKGKELDEAESEDCYRGLEPYVKQYLKQKMDDAEPDEKEKCNKLLLELTELQLSPVPSDPEKRKSEELARIAQEFLTSFAEQSTKTAAEDEAEARAIYLESMDAEQVSKCFQQQRARGA